MPHILFTNDEVKALIEAFDNHYLTGIEALFPNEQLDRNTRNNIRAEFARTGNVFEPTEYQRAVMLDAVEDYLMRFHNPDVILSNQQQRTKDALESLRLKLMAAANPKTT